MPVSALVEQGILTPTAFNVAKIVTLTERSSEDDLTQVPEFLRYAALGAWLGGISTAVKWWIGDWLNFGEGAWGERYAQAAEATGLDIGTLQNRAYVCRQVLPSRRREDLSFTAHLKVAKLEPAAQTKWLEHAAKHKLRSKDLEIQIRANGGEVPGRRRQVDEPAETEQQHLETTDIDPYLVLVAARRVWKDARSDGNGHYLVPRDTFQSLATALGKGD